MNFVSVGQPYISLGKQTTAFPLSFLPGQCCLQSTRTVMAYGVQKLFFPHFFFFSEEKSRIHIKVRVFCTTHHP